MNEKEALKAQWHTTIHGDGGECPTCERFGKVYSRGLNDTMAKSLEWLYDQNTKQGVRTWINVPSTAPAEVIRTNQLPSLRWWGLVERELPAPGSKQKHSGNWRVTLRGADFVEGKMLVPKKVMTYNGEAVGYSDEQTDITSCHKASFDINDVMTTTNLTERNALFRKALHVQS